MSVCDATNNLCSSHIITPHVHVELFNLAQYRKARGTRVRFPRQAGILPLSKAFGPANATNQSPDHTNRGLYSMANRPSSEGNHLSPSTIWYDMFINCNWVVTRWQQYSTHLHTTIHRTTQNKQYIEQHNSLGECGPCPVLASYTLAFALQLRKMHGNTSVRVEKNLSQGRKNLSQGSEKPQSGYMEESFWRRLWTCRQTEYWMNVCLCFWLITHANRVSCLGRHLFLRPRGCSVFNATVISI